MKILVIEDMTIIREGIIQKLKDMPYQIDEIYSGINGEDGLKQLRKHEIDIVLTDIRMPVMDGLSFIRSALEEGFSPEFIIVTGFEDFEYARKAIEMGVIGFVLKPIDEKFKEVFDKALDNLKKKRAYSVVMKEKKNYEEQMKNMERLHEINHVLLNQSAQAYEFPDDAFSILVMMDFANTPDTVVVNNKIEPILKVLGVPYVFTNNVSRKQEYFLVLYHCNKTQLEEASVDVASRIKAWYPHGDSPIVSISHSSSTLNAEMYEQAELAGLRRFFDDNQSVYLSAVEDATSNYSHIQDEIKAIQYYVKRHDHVKTKGLIKEHFNMTHFQEMPYASSLIFSFALMRDMILNHFRIQLVDEEAGALFNSRRFLKNSQSLETLGDFFVSVILKHLTDYEQHQHESTYSNNIKVYIDYNYEKCISLQSLSKEFGMNPSYLSTIFKKATDMKLSTYITEVRINKACELLRQSDETVSSISLSVGYDDPQYFYRVFKKVKGETPLKYRKNRISG